jgi:hypothetical protein
MRIWKYFGHCFGQFLLDFDYFTSVWIKCSEYFAVYFLGPRTKSTVTETVRSDTVSVDGFSVARATARAATLSGPVIKHCVTGGISM